MWHCVRRSHVAQRFMPCCLEQACIFTVGAERAFLGCIRIHRSRQAGKTHQVTVYNTFRISEECPRQNPFHTHKSCMT
jgi:hypothetical protein